MKKSMFLLLTVAAATISHQAPAEVPISRLTTSITCRGSANLIGTASWASSGNNKVVSISGFTQYTGPTFDIGDNNTWAVDIENLAPGQCLYQNSNSNPRSSINFDTIEITRPSSEVIEYTGTTASSYPFPFNSNIRVTSSANYVAYTYQDYFPSASQYLQTITRYTAVKNFPLLPLDPSYFENVSCWDQASCLQKRMPQLIDAKNASIWNVYNVYYFSGATGVRTDASGHKILTVSISSAPMRTMMFKGSDLWEMNYGDGYKGWSCTSTTCTQFLE